MLRLLEDSRSKRRWRFCKVRFMASTPWFMDSRLSLHCWASKSILSMVSSFLCVRISQPGHANMACSNSLGWRYFTISTFRILFYAWLAARTSAVALLPPPSTLIASLRHLSQYSLCLEVHFLRQLTVLIRRILADSLSGSCGGRKALAGVVGTRKPDESVLRTPEDCRYGCMLTVPLVCPGI